MNRPPEPRVLKGGTKVPAFAPVAASDRSPRDSSVQPVEAMLHTNLSNVRRIRPITSEELERIMRETGLPHPDEGEGWEPTLLQTVVTLLIVAVVCFACFAVTA